MHRILSPIVLATLILASPLLAEQTDMTPAPKQPAAAKKMSGPRQRLSPHETISNYVGGNRQTGSLLTITYGRPYSARGGKGEPRKIWGGLVPWDKADRLGADEATLLVTPVALQIGDTTIPAGAYTLYIAPSEKGASKLAFSTNIGKWGIPVDETHDLARVDLTKETLPDTVGQLTMVIDSTATGGVLRITWENTQFSLPFTVKKNG
jgi:hypothetical protein